MDGKVSLVRLARAVAPLLLLTTATTTAARAQEKGFSVEAPAASAIARQSDDLFNLMLGLTILISGAICVLIVGFCFHYRRGHKADRSNPPQENLKLELTWTIIPTILGLAVFVWGARVYYDMYKAPPGAMTIFVVGKQWMWHLQHPEGRREINELHIPVGRPIRLLLSSQDVIHDFYVPAFRTKQDAVPGRYTEESFTATRIGRYRFFCAQYCGTDHSKMAGWVYVMKPAEYQMWLSSGAPQRSMVSEGENLFQQYGCSGCHGPASTVHGPSLVGIYNRPVPLQNHGWATADDKYLHDSIVLPSAQIAAGYPNVMPAYQGKLTEEQIAQIVFYIRSLGKQPMDSLVPPVGSAADTGGAAAAASAETQNGQGTGTAPGDARAASQASGHTEGPAADQAAGQRIRVLHGDAAQRKGNE